MTAKGKPHPRAEHPLFPVPPDTEDSDLADRDISWIYVIRGNITATRKFSAAELVDEEQIAELYGGGQYTVKARNENKSRWTASRELRIDGPSKPMTDTAPEPVAPAAPSPAVEVSSPAIRDGLAIASVLGPLVLQMLESSARRSEAQTNLLIQVLAANKPNNNEQMQMMLMQAALNRNPSAETFGMMNQAMQLGMQLGNKGEDDNSLDLFEQFNAGMQNVVELERLKKERQGAAQTPKPPPAGSGEPK